MQTPAILNISSPSASPASANRAAATPNNSFNQMLSQQVAERRDADKAAQTRAAEKPAANEAKPADAQQPAAARPQETKQTSSSGESKETAAAEQDKQEQTAEAGNIPLTATELLAQLASAGQQSQVPADVSTAVGDVPTKVDIAALKGKQNLLGAAEPDAKKELTAAEDTQAEFGATLREAGQHQGASQDADIQSAIAADARDNAGKAVLDKQKDLPAAAKLPDSPAINAATQVQPGALNAVQAAGGKTMESLAPHVGTPAWDQALGQKVVWMVAGAQQSASLTLNPPDLGPMQVVLNVSNGQADASFYAAQPEVRQALEAALPKLRDMLDQAGVALGQASVSAGMPDRHNEASSQSARQTGRGTNGENSNEDVPVQAARTITTASGRGLVDAYV